MKTRLKMKNRSQRYDINRPTIIFIIFWDFLIFDQIFFLPQVKWWAIITFKHGIYETLSPNPGPNLAQPPDTGRNPDGYLPSADPWSIPTKRNCYNPRTRDDIDVKPGPVTKHAKRNKTMSKNLPLTSCGKFWRHWNFLNLRPIWSNPEAGFWMQSLYNLYFH